MNTDPVLTRRPGFEQRRPSMGAAELGAGPCPLLGPSCLRRRRGRQSPGPERS